MTMTRSQYIEEVAYAVAFDERLAYHYEADLMQCFALGETELQIVLEMVQEMRRAARMI